MSGHDIKAGYRSLPLLFAFLPALLLADPAVGTAVARNGSGGPVASGGAVKGCSGAAVAPSGKRALEPRAAARSVAAYEITSPAVLLSGNFADGQLHDFMMENDRIAVVISGIGHSVHYALSGGNIIDAGSSVDRLDAIMEVYTYFDDDWPRQAVYSALQVVDDGSMGGPAVIRVSGLDSVENALTVVTDYSLAAGAEYLDITTTVTNTGQSTFLDFELGDAFTWGDCRAFAPWYGFELTGKTTDGPWLAFDAEPITYGYAGHHGDMWGPHGGNWSDMNIHVVTLGAGSSVSYERDFVVVGDIASAATLIHANMNIPVGDLTCSVRDRSTGAPIPGAVIDARDTLGALYFQMNTDVAGMSGATLPPGNWHLIATATNHIPHDTWLVVTTGSSVSFDFYLDKIGPVAPVLREALRPPGDTLTVIQRPLVNIPALVTEGDLLEIDCDAAPGATGWTAALIRDQIEIPLSVTTSTYDPSTLWWRVSCLVPQVPLYELYDLRVTADGAIADTTRNAVKVIPGFKQDYTFLHITDTHLPTHMYYYEPGSDNDRSEVVDLLEVVADIEIINPEFVLLTGDFINEGELEDYLNWRVYTRGQELLSRFPVPVYLTAGNHDIGGWAATPPPNGTARRDWWRFFGWKRLDNPPPGAPWHTQNYSFDYGPVHYVGLESYDNYDGWRYNIYGGESFTPGQIQWLNDDLASAAGSTAQVLFYHYDFKHELNLNSLGVEMALWGHVHHDNGNINVKPYDLATNNVCDGQRSYRLIKVSGGTLQPAETLSAGSNGQNLTADFTPANNGMHDHVNAAITNNQDQRFEQGLLKFVMPKGYGNELLTGGTLYQVDRSGDFAIYYVNVDIHASSAQAVDLQLFP
jgi:3',5'-cyclic AMP phosphodiesterase CpdA